MDANGPTFAMQLPNQRAYFRMLSHAFAQKSSRKSWCGSLLADLASGSRGKVSRFSQDKLAFDELR
jgi:hypothetical protein